MTYKTKILSNNQESIEYAKELLLNGEVVGIPTETVYGLAANALDSKAVAKIFKAKGRPCDNPLIVHISSMDMIDNLVSEIPPLAIKCAEKFWPGPLTMIMTKSNIIPTETSGGLKTVGIRMPSNKTARAIIKACGLPLAAPSANLSGSPSPTTAQHVFEDMDGRIDCIIDDGCCAVGVESTVITFDNDIIKVLRPGFISVSDLNEITSNVEVDAGVIEEVASNAIVSSPGMKYKHYSPKADVVIIDSNLENFRKYVSENVCDKTWCMTFSENDVDPNIAPSIAYGDTDENQAHLLFETLRELDKKSATKVFARCPNKTGVGLAVYNRLLRAAGFQVVKI